MEVVDYFPPSRDEKFMDTMIQLESLEKSHKELKNMLNEVEFILKMANSNDFLNVEINYREFLNNRKLLRSKICSLEESMNVLMNKLN